MDITKLMAIAEQLKAPAPKAETAPAAPAKPRIQVYMGGVVTRTMIRKALGLPSVLERWTESKVEEHKAGGRCPHCMGTGRYRFHTDASRNEKCFRCHGKGRLDEKDLAFLTRRLRGGEPLCKVVSAAAA